MAKKNVPAKISSMIEELNVTVPDSRSSQSRIDLYFGEYPELLNSILSAVSRHVSYETIASKLTNLTPPDIDITGGIVSGWAKRNKGKTFE